MVMMKQQLAMTCGRSLIAQDNKLLEDDGTAQARNWSILQPHNHERQAKETRSLNHSY